ncbi:hypothetical protein [Nonomuraea ceibae]|uniref:hypothetical protein n=1 Tax=Nonomuraea ceibae TaxID=1935170 RepID=UPI001C5D6336|nr:hypothetical protein [Nonomuraea ceibae]
MITEDELAGALRTIADRAEDRDVLTGVETKRRRRTRKRLRRTLATACSLAAGWGVLVAWPTYSGVDTAQPATNTVERMWPDALFTMPGQSRPLAAISATQVLVWAERGALEVYDAASGRSRPVTALAQAPLSLAVDHERVVWLADGHAWAAPLQAGGKMTKIGPVPGGEHVDRIALAGRYLVWSSPLDGVWRMSVTGGAPERVATGLQIVQWPWATDEPLDTRANPTKVVNLQTGRSIKISAVPGAEGLRCGPTWCTGSRGQEHIVQKIDGSWSRTYRAGSPGYPYRDRFFVGLGEIYDASTDATVAFEGAKIDASGGRKWSEGNGVVFWPHPAGVRVVNLAAIPRA